MYMLVDTFNDSLISRHRSLGAAVAAQDRYGRAVGRANPGSYIPMTIRWSPTGKWGDMVPLTDEQVDEMYAIEGAMDL